MLPRADRVGIFDVATTELRILHSRGLATNPGLLLPAHQYPIPNRTLFIQAFRVGADVGWEAAGTGNRELALDGFQANSGLLDLSKTTVKRRWLEAVPNPDPPNRCSRSDEPSWRLFGRAIRRQRASKPIKMAPHRLARAIGVLIPYRLVNSGVDHLKSVSGIGRNQMFKVELLKIVDQLSDQVFEKGVPGCLGDRQMKVEIVIIRSVFVRCDRIEYSQRLGDRTQLLCCAVRCCKCCRFAFNDFPRASHSAVSVAALFSSLTWRSVFRSEIGHAKDTGHRQGVLAQRHGILKRNASRKTGRLTWRRCSIVLSLGKGSPGLIWSASTNSRRASITPS